MTVENAKYAIGQVIHHRLFGYRGLIYDVDPCFQYTEQWYNTMAHSRPARNQPWYHILVDHSDLITYVAEQYLEDDDGDLPIEHPDISKYFHDCDQGMYTPKRLQN